MPAQIRLIALSLVLLASLLGWSRPAVAFIDMCERDYNQCMDSCDRVPPGPEGSPRARCVGQCGLMFDRCLNGPPTRTGAQMGTPGGTTTVKPPLHKLPIINQKPANN